MKITGKTSAAPNIPASLPPKSPEPTLYSDLRPSKTSHKPHRRRTRLRSVAPAGKRSSRPETPLLKWKTEEKEKNVVSIEDDEQDFPEPRRRGSQRDNPVSARKLAAVLWRLNLPEASMAAEARESGVTHRGEDEQVMSLSRARASSLGHRNGKVYAAEAKDPIHSPSSASGARNGLCKLEPSFRFSNCAMEGLTKWDPVTTSNEARELYSNVKLFDRQVGVASVISSLESELEQARTHIVELKSEQRNSKKKLDHFLKKLSEEKSSWRRKEHEKIRAFIEDVKSDLHRERKNRQRTEIMNAKLVDELAEAKLLSKRYLQDYEKERKTRELVEEVCDELAKEIGEDKAEVEEIEKESMRFREEVEEERKMLQMAEVWREERVQMKLIDAKVALEEKYSQMNKLVADLENFLRSINSNPDLLEAELLRHAAASVNIQDINDFHYEPGNPDDIFSILEEMNFSPQQCPPSKMHALSPKCTNANSRNKKVHNSNLSNMEEEDESGWETVSNIDDEQGSSYSPESVNKNPQSKAQSDSETDTAMSEVSEVCSVRGKQSRKVSSIAARLWRSVPTNGEKDNCKVVSVEGMRLSNGATMSPDGGSGFSTSEIMEPLSSPETGHPQVGRVIKKGCMEWPRGVHRNSLKSKLLEARMESQKVQLRQVLKHKM